MAILDENATEIQKLALGVIGDIEKYGHYQGEGTHYLQALTLPGSEKKFTCCVLSNPTLESAGADDAAAFSHAFVAAAGAPTLDRPGGLESVTINDALTTDEVIDILWAIVLG